MATRALTLILQSLKDRCFARYSRLTGRLGRAGYKVLFGIAGVLSLVHIGFFTATGAWPIALFFGLDFFLLYGAFRLNNRAARAREDVSISRASVQIRKLSPSGRETQFSYNPFWTRFQITRHTEIGITGMHVTGQGRSTQIGAFLNPDDRESFASAFSAALATVKRRL